MRVALMFALALLFLVLLAHAGHAADPPACSHWASPQGQGSSCTPSAPCQPQTFVDSVAQPGRVLCMQDGTYGNLSVPASFAGTVGQPIWLRAEHEGKVRLGSGAGARPVHLQGSYGVLWGVNIRGGDNATLRFYTNSQGWQVQRVVIQAMGGVNAAVDMQGQDNLLEDFAAFGQARYVVSASTSGGGNTVRRGWVRWQDNQQLETESPTASVLMGYGQDRLTYENLLVTWNTTGRVTDPAGLGALWSTQGSRWLGSIFYVTPTDVFHGEDGFGGSVDAGSAAQQGNFHPTRDLLWKHNVVYLAPGNPSVAGKPAILFAECTDAGCQPGSNNLVQNSVGVGAVPSTVSASFTASGLQDGGTLAEAIGAGQSVWTHANAAPGICRRYKDGVLTNEPLWPFPMNQRLLDYMQAEGLTPVDVTGTLEALLGTIPASCKTGGAPGPGTDTTPPTVQITAPSHGAIVSGTVAVTAEAADNVGITAVQFQVNGLARGTHCCSHVSGTVDTTQYPNGVYTLTAEAHDAAGNRTVSTATSVLVYNGQRPPTPTPGPHPALACHGALGAAGVIDLRCVPEGVR